MDLNQQRDCPPRASTAHLRPRDRVARVRHLRQRYVRRLEVGAAYRGAIPDRLARLTEVQPETNINTASTGHGEQRVRSHDRVRVHCG